jgi:hypothetical protein
MKRGVPLNSPEGRRLVERGPAWREHPDYYAPEPPDEDIPWHTEKDVDLAVARMTNLLAQQAGAFTGYERRCRILRDELARAGGQHVLRDLARVALGMRVTP